MSTFGQVNVKNRRYKMKGEFHHPTPNTPIRNEDDGLKLMGVTNPRAMTYIHMYGGEAPFFEALGEGKLLATRCDNPDCEYKGTVYQDATRITLGRKSGSGGGGRSVPMYSPFGFGGRGGGLDKDGVQKFKAIAPGDYEVQVYLNGKGWKQL